MQHKRVFGDVYVNLYILEHLFRCSGKRIYDPAFCDHTGTHSGRHSAATWEELFLCEGAEPEWIPRACGGITNPSLVLVGRIEPELILVGGAIVF